MHLYDRWSCNIKKTGCNENLRWQKNWFNLGVPTFLGPRSTYQVTNFPRSTIHVLTSQTQTLRFESAIVYLRTLSCFYTTTRHHIKNLPLSSTCLNRSYCRKTNYLRFPTRCEVYVSSVSGLPVDRNRLVGHSWLNFSTKNDCVSHAYCKY